MKIVTVLILLMMVIFVCAFLDANAQSIIHYDDEDGHREPWSEWVNAECVSEPYIVMDSSYFDPPCNPATHKGFTVWACHTELDTPDHISHYTAHWYCGVTGEPITKPVLHTFLPFVSK